MRIEPKSFGVLIPAIIFVASVSNAETRVFRAPLEKCIQFESELLGRAQPMGKGASNDQEAQQILALAGSLTSGQNAHDFPRYLGATTEHLIHCLMECGQTYAQSRARPLGLILLSTQMGGDIVQFCQPCGKPAKRLRVDSAVVEDADAEYIRVAVNGTGTDLAYTYVRTGPRRWTNVAKLIGCPTDGVSSFLNEPSRGVFSPVLF